MSSPIRVLIVDDHATFRQPLAFMLNREPDLSVIAEAGSVAEARHAHAQAGSAIDVMIVDLQLPDGTGIDVIAAFCVSNGNGNALVLTANTDKLSHARAIEAGASGVISKTAQFAEIVAGVRRVFAGEPLQSAQEMMELLRLAGQERARDQAAEMTLTRLTPRERQVLEALVQGLDNRAIAERLFITPDTARAHVVKLLAKLKVESRLQAAIFAITHGIGTANTVHRQCSCLHPPSTSAE